MSYHDYEPGTSPIERRTATEALREFNNPEHLFTNLDWVRMERDLWKHRYNRLIKALWLAVLYGACMTLAFIADWITK